MWWLFYFTSIPVSRIYPHWYFSGLSAAKQEIKSTCSRQCQGAAWRQIGLAETLNDENSFEIVIKKINDGKPIQLKNLSDIPSEFSIKYDDADDYKALLD